MPTSSPRRILALNSGSSSLKFGLYASGTEETRLAGGKIEATGAAAVRKLRLALETAGRIDAVGYRIVHGGPKHLQPKRLSATVLQDLRALSTLDPEHLPPALAVIAAARKEYPSAQHIACFDTAFFADLPERAQRFALPERYYRAGLRRYGFHGISYQYLLEALRREAGAEAARGRVLLAHLGSGCSLAAVVRGKPVDTTMGFMPSGGLVMATRCGDLDPGVVLELLRQRLSPAALARLVNQKSGMLGISGRSGDLRVLEARAGADGAAARALDLFGYSAVKFAGAMIAAMGGVDTIVFSGGIGEHDAAVRARIAGGLGFAGVKLDAARNRRHAALVSPEGAAVAVRVIPTDEERMIARACARLLA